MSLRLRLLLLTPILAAAACGTSPNTACADAATERCAQRLTCTNGVGITKVYGDMTTCLAREKLACTDALAAKSTGNTPERVEQCVTAIKSQSCADYFAGNTPAACVNTGALTDGTACAFAGQCSSTYCTGVANAACGTCGQAIASGGDCANNGTCARGQTCVSVTAMGTTTQTCQTGAASGAGCSRTMPCATGLSCVGAINAGMNPTPGTCMAAATMAGAACDPLLRTGAGCDRSVGLFCNATSKTCTTITFAANGATCGLGTDGNLTDCQNGACYGSVIAGMTPVAGTCKANVTEGGACDVTNGPDCLAPARCVTSAGASTGTCALPDGNAC